MNKQLAKLNREDVLWKAKNGMVLNLLELTLVSGYAYSQWSSWKYRGLPLVQGKISLKRAMDWIQKEEMAPESKTSQVYDLCQKMSSVLFDIWIDLQFKFKARDRKEITRTVDEIQAEYRALRRHINTPRPLTKPILDFDPVDPNIPVSPPPPRAASILESPFSAKEEKALDKAQSGMVLNVGELATALGYSSSTIRKWKRDGLPLTEGKITKREAWEWRKAYLASLAGISGPADDSQGERGTGA